MNVLDQEIDEGPDTCGKMFVTGIHGVNEFDIFRIIGFQYSHQRSGIDIRLYMELTHTSEAKAGEAKAASCRSVVGFEVAKDGSREATAIFGIAEWPFLRGRAEAEGQAVVTIEILRAFRDALPFQIAG